MSKVKATIRWTYDDYVHFPDDGRRYELIEGERVVTPAPSPRHQFVSRNLSTAMQAFVKVHDLGTTLYAPLDVILDDASIVQPDVLFIAKKRLDLMSNRGFEGAPDLVVELLSPNTHRRDYVEKRRLYAAHGVREYWVVDTEIPRVEIFVLQKGALAKVSEVTEGNVASPVVLSGFSVGLEDLLCV